jgi:SM-20-related protein
MRMSHEASALPTLGTGAAAQAGAASSIVIVDDVFPEATQREVHGFLKGGGWVFGWKSNQKADPFAFWHRHFAGNIHPDHLAREGKGQQYDCAAELGERVPLLHRLWLDLARGALAGHRLVRCYANGHPFGSEGSVHTDSVSPLSFTSVYYPHDAWHPNWGGETVFFTGDKSDIVAAVYPRPNRLLVFPGTIPHAARGVTRVCPEMRITLMFKTEREPA